MHYNHKNVEYARKLRKEMTPWERKLWYCFLNKYPIRFYRQRTIDQYIVDFYCPKAGLILELDGGGHYTEEARVKDDDRTKNLEQFGFKVIRFSNKEVDKEFYSVCTVIDREVKNRRQR